MPKLSTFPEHTQLLVERLDNDTKKKCWKGVYVIDSHTRRINQLNMYYQLVHTFHIFKPSR